MSDFLLFYFPPELSKSDSDMASKLFTVTFTLTLTLTFTFTVTFTFRLTISFTCTQENEKPRVCLIH